MLFKTFEENTKGIDYVCGDIHGCFGQLIKELMEIEFNFSDDRLFAVGDLIDRGTKSEKCLHFLQQPWFFSIIGNHELMMLKALNSREMKNKSASIGLDEHEQSWRLSGGEWWFQLSDEKLIAEIPPAIENLPFAIQLSVNGSQIGLVHSEIIGASWDEVKAELLEFNDESILSYYRISKYGEMLLWGRDRFHSKSSTPVEGIDLLCVGHTIVDDIQLLGNSVYLDTGAFMKKKKNLSKYKISIKSVSQLLDIEPSRKIFHLPKFIDNLIRQI